MKKLTLLFVLLFSFAAMVSQNWCPPGARWLYHLWSGIVPADGYAEFIYTKDTVILGKTCKLIEGTFAGIYGYPYFTPKVISNYGRYYTYEENSVLFRYNGSSGFDTVVDYKAVPGNKWREPIVGPCDHRRDYHVVDTSILKVNGFPMRVLHMEYYVFDDWDTIPRTIQFSLHEKIDSFVFEVLPYFCVYPYIIAEVPMVSLECYEDSVIGTYQFGNSCLKGVGLRENQNDLAISIGPNPFNGGFVISTYKNYNHLDLRLSDVTGREVFDRRVVLHERKAKVDVDLAEGVYFLNIKSGLGEETTIKVLKQ